jgi:hypothetical protein
MMSVNALPPIAPSAAAQTDADPPSSGCCRRRSLWQDGVAVPEMDVDTVISGVTVCSHIHMN